MEHGHKRPAFKPRWIAITGLLLTTALAAGCTTKPLVEVGGASLDSPAATSSVAAMQGTSDTGTAGGSGSGSGAGSGAGSDGAGSGDGSGGSSGGGPGNGNGNSPNSGNGGGNLNGSGPGSGNGGANNGGGGRAH